MASSPTLLHGINESSDGQLDLEDTNDLGKLIGKTLFNTFSKSFQLTGPPITGTLDDYTFTHSGSERKNLKEDIKIGICTLKFTGYANANFSISFASKNGAKNIVPLIESMEYKDNEIISISDDGQAIEKIRYTFDANLDLSSSTSYLNTRADINTNVKGKCGYLGNVINTSPSFKINRNNDRIQFPSNHPISFSIELYKKTYAANKKIAISTVADQLVSKIGLGKYAKYIGADVLAKMIAKPIVNAMDYNVNQALNQQEGQIAGQINSILSSDQFLKSDVFNNFADTYRDVVIEESWNRSDYPVDGFSLQATIKNDLLNGTRSDETIDGMKGDDILRGKAGDDKIIGGKGDDKIYGGRGNDLFSGGLGKDKLFGGPGADTFVYKSANHSKPNSPDTIKDFEFTKGGDKIDLSSVTSKDLVFINQELFSGTPGEVRFKNSILELDLNGDATSDMSILIKGAGKIETSNLVF